MSTSKTNSNDEVGVSYAPGYSAIPSSDIPPPTYSSSRSLFTDEDHESQEDKFNSTLEQTDLMIRMNFVRKVYTILAMQLGLTTVVGAFCMYNKDVKEWTQNNPWALFLSFIGTFINLFALMAYRRSHPVNFYLLGSFTLLESYAIGTVVSFYDSNVVLQAVILTFAMFIGLTIFTLQSKWSFEGWGPLFLPFSSGVELGFSIVIAILFSAYIIYDTNMIFTRLSPEEYISASVELYLDILNLFLAILRILGNSRD
ncbi:hypothetical protein HK098_008307 [Nowakowskiella sp. JEL0407]|nr:hypothetical protein HK098_008307 [Nowakowskiella sp. JEL0407]